MEYWHIVKISQYKKICKNSFSNELGRLSQSMGERVKCVDTVIFVNYDYIPSELFKYITYVRIVVDLHPQKY